MKKTLLIILIISCSAFRLLADEGMWMVNLVEMYNYEKMQQAGCKIPANKIYNENAPSLKDAIVSFGGYCTAEFVSTQGLLFTNHHCGFESIASLSNVEANYLDKGYWAKNNSEEIPVPGLFVSVLVRIQEVTDSILPKVNNMTGSERSGMIAGIIARLTKGANPDQKYKVEVKPFYNGNQYFLFVYQVYNDVRFVGAPPSSIGKFGGDTDNWMWPRHTGDFSIFRVYANENNEPADYNASNKPFVPKYALNVSTAPLKEGDFTMIMGFPGRIDRYQTSYGMDFVQNVQCPTYINIFKATTDAMKMEMDKNPEAKIKMAADYASQMNTLKLFQGQLDGFARLNPVNMKQTEEAEFMKWVASQSADEQKKYKDALTELETSYKTMSAITAPMFYPFLSTSLVASAQIAAAVSGLEEPLKNKMPSDSLKMVVDEVNKEIKTLSEAFYTSVDENALIGILKAYHKNVESSKQAPIMKEILAMNPSNTDASIEMYVKKMFMTSFVTDKNKLNAFMAKPSLKVMNKDPYIKFYNDILNTGMTYRMQYVQAQQSQQSASRNYVAGLMKQRDVKTMYPDANFTMRLTYGTVKDYIPRDAVSYSWYTTIKGIIEKYKAGDLEFDVPKELRDDYANKDYGDYGINGDMPVCFLSDNDITGGNSGSPILNANGDLIGLAFDGNYEGTACNYIFEGPMNRTINVCSNYVLFVIDEVYGAKNIIKELNIVQ
jgi:hypothetical protein